MNAPAGIRTCLYDTQALERVMDRMAMQAVPLLQDRDKVAVIGILRRGAPLADQLVDRLTRQHGLPPPLRLDLKVKRYADDLTLLHPETQLTEAAGQADVVGARLEIAPDHIIECNVPPYEPTFRMDLLQPRPTT